MNEKQEFVINEENSIENYSENGVNEEELPHEEKVSHDHEHNHNLEQLHKPHSHKHDHKHDHKHGHKHDHKHDHQCKQDKYSSPSIHYF